MTESSADFLVVGAGQAAATFCGRLRELQPAAAIVLIGEEPVAPYQRPPLSKKYMTGEMSAARLLLRAEEWWAENRIDCRFGRRAVAIDRAARTVTLDDGARVGYGTLLLATGATPRSLPAATGGGLPGVHLLRGIADADRLGAEMKPGRRLLIVGGGYIGLEAAAVASKLGLSVTLAESAPRILGRVAAAPVADHFHQLHRGHGIDIREGVALVRLEARDGRLARAVFAEGPPLAIDLCLVGIGVSPNDALARDCGLAIDNGIAVDEFCRTSDPAVLAAGDCASFIWSGRRIRLESVQNAIDQAEAAARTAAGAPQPYVPLPWFWSDQYDTKLQIAGLNLGHDRVVVRPGGRPGSQSVWYFAAGKFLAVDAINDPRAYMIGKKLLETGRPLSPEQAADPSFDLKALA
jgi:3-phenylpropionate/trans-cinnamate dioxygenase ferredoxin reductase subunit